MAWWGVARRGDIAVEPDALPAEMLATAVRDALEAWLVKGRCQAVLEREVLARQEMASRLGGLL